MPVLNNGDFLFFSLILLFFVFFCLFFGVLVFTKVRVAGHLVVILVSSFPSS